MFTFNLKKPEKWLGLHTDQSVGRGLRGAHVGTAVSPNTKFARKLLSNSAIKWCSENYPEAIFDLAPVFRADDIKMDLTISGIHPLIDGKTFDEIDKELNKNDPIFLGAVSINSSLIMSLITVKDKGPILSGWVLHFNSETKAVEFRLRFGEEYPLVR